eukprot:3827411-Pleurochrysis_carterae.AAC.1
MMIAKFARLRIIFRSPAAILVKFLGGVVLFHVQLPLLRLLQRARCVGRCHPPSGGALSQQVADRGGDDDSAQRRPALEKRCRCPLR